MYRYMLDACMLLFNVAFSFHAVSNHNSIVKAFTAKNSQILKHQNICHPQYGLVVHYILAIIRYLITTRKWMYTCVSTS